MNWRLVSRQGLFETFLDLHLQSKDRFFPGGGQRHFGTESYREVFEFQRFRTIGSARRLALGAMHAPYDKARTAREVAQAGVMAGCEFDTSSAVPMRVQTFKLKSSSKG